MSEASGPAPELLADARALLPGMVELRRRLHRHPEIGLQLPVTQAVILEELGRLGLPTSVGRSLTSVVSEIRGQGEGPTILLRADMDALPIQEETGLEFASDVPGAMHACGHDLHVAMLLGAARLLAERSDRVSGRILLMFQPGEEGHDGARAMIEEGIPRRHCPASEQRGFRIACVHPLSRRDDLPAIRRHARGQRHNQNHSSGPRWTRVRSASRDRSDRHRGAPSHRAPVDRSAPGRSLRPSRGDNLKNSRQARRRA